MWSFTRRRIVHAKFRCGRRPTSSSSTTNESCGLYAVKQPPVPDVVRKPPRLPFLKSIYAGQYDVEVLTYPETLNLERHRDLESRVKGLRQSGARIDTARQSGLFGMSAPYPSSGLNLSDTEIARVFEHFDCDTYRLMRDHTLCVDVVKTFGTPGQKSHYLPLFASGATCSLHDTDTVKATSLPNQSWELTGSVEACSAQAFVLIVIGNRAFIVEKDKTSVLGDRLQLRQVVVHPDDVLDNVDLTKIVYKGKLYTCSVLISSVKKLIQSTIMNVLPKHRLNMKLREFDSVLKIFGKSLVNTYTIESMIYLTTWMTDGFHDPDVELETAAIQLFARQMVGTTLTELKMLNGRNSIKEPYLTLCNDISDLIENLEGNIKLANFISSRGVDFFNKSDYKEKVSFLTVAYRNIMMKRNKPHLKYGLQQFLHPALMYSADFLEHCVLKFQFIVDQTNNAGQLDTDNEMLMERLSMVITYIYAMTAVLGRASRSYCTGIRFCDHEMTTAETVIRELYAIVNPILEELASGKYVATDSVYESLAYRTLTDNVQNEQTKT